jgi:ABC-type uncharacterized transport system permease subunit
MQSPVTTLALVGLTVMSGAASVGAIRGLRGGVESKAAIWRRAGLAGVTLGAGAVFIYRWLALHASWQPLESHVDGLLLLAALLTGTAWYLGAPSRLPGLPAFAMPLTTLLVAWAFCASWFTFRPFSHFTTLWKSVHLACVYLGTLSYAIASMAAAAYLYARRQMRVKGSPLTTARLGAWASLETLEKLTIRWATLGFALLTLGLATGLVVVSSGPTRLGPTWWVSPKVLLATASWASYALLMNVRFASAFRGARAAWLAIAGLVLILATFGAVSALAAREGREPTAGPPGAAASRRPTPEPDACA